MSSYAGESSTRSVLDDYLCFRNGKTSPARSEVGSHEVFGSNGLIGRAERSNVSGPVIVIGRVGSFCGSLHYSFFDAWVTDNAISCTPRDSAETRFWYYALQTLALNDRSSGSGQPLLNQAVLGSIPFEAPIQPVRLAIAEVLGALDDKFAANLRVADVAFELAGTLYDHAVAAVPVRMMSQVLTPILGGTPSRANGRLWGGSHLWAAAKDVTGAQSGVIVDTDEQISDLAVASTKAKPLPVGGVILTARGTVGAVARLAIPSSFNQSCYGFAPGELPAGVLYFSILRATERAKAFAHGSVFDTITMKTFDHLNLPDLDSAQVSSLETLVTPLLDTVTSAVTQNRALAATRDALLPALMSGKLRVRDAEKVLEGVL